MFLRKASGVAGKGLRISYGVGSREEKPGIPKMILFVGDNFIAANGIFHIR